jgi:hypothetical protein
VTIRITVHNDGSIPGQFVAAAECGFDEQGRMRLLRKHPWLLGPGAYQTFYITPEQAIVTVLGPRHGGGGPDPVIDFPDVPAPQQPVDVLG